VWGVPIGSHRVPTLWPRRPSTGAGSLMTDKAPGSMTTSDAGECSNMAAGRRRRCGVALDQAIQPWGNGMATEYGWPRCGASPVQVPGEQGDGAQFRVPAHLVCPLLLIRALER